jgi:hypothetical protein
MEEQHDNIIDYAKEIKRNHRRESWEYFKQGITDKEQWNDVGKQIKRRFSRKSKNK